ncbi:GA-like domain-containing protein [Streptococcus sp. CSL10205-OR2]|uniref:GA-like domain-containing protein n=1 Tax=Streptococcus sp. CSL10205-OR2 TaxID=2980558 RepID=UPI0021DA0343|nr:peptidase [Streptococcus sp. CSL10205-OR2]MCU9532972.1 peptidase [Streptococcus sp. CSL10205-OR2]
MKTSKNELVYLILSIIVIAFASFIYIVFGRTNQTTKVDDTQMTQVETSTETTTEDNKDDELINLANERLADYRLTPNDDTKAVAQTAIDAINDVTKKQELQSTLDTLSTEITNQANAETAVLNAEGYQVQSNVDLAQNAINSLTDQTKKTELQARLDVVIANINAYNQSLNPSPVTEQ